MTYRYLYQTRENENKSGEIKARNRADAYFKLRKIGIRPYRLIGDDPPNWRPWAYGALVVALAAAVLGLAARVVVGLDGVRPEKRQQLTGDSQVIAEGVASGWDGVFSSPLDRHLSAYAQPGWLFEPPPLDAAGTATFADSLAEPMARSDDETPVIRQLKNIVLQMRLDMKDYLASGGTVEDYLEFLSERQNREFKTREAARETLENAPQEMKRRTWLNLNIRLSDLGIATLPDPGE